MDGGAWWAAVHGVAKSRTQRSGFTFTFHFHALEKEMATHSSVLAWRIPGTGEPGGLPSVGSHKQQHRMKQLPPWLKRMGNQGCPWSWLPDPKLLWTLGKSFKVFLVTVNIRFLYIYSNILAWEFPWTAEPGGLWFMESQKRQIWLSN